MSTPNVNITGEVVVWARQRLGVSVEDIAGAIGMDTDTLASWEKGVTEPTFRQAHRLAHVLKIPFGYLFLSERPTDSPPLPDLRTVGGAQPQSTPDLIDVLNDVLRKQHWYSEFLAENGAEPLAFVGKFSLDDPVSNVAADIRDTLHIDDELRRQCATWGEFLATVVRLAESEGILVMRSGTVAGNTHRPLEVSEFRGFAIADVFAPTVFINSKDAKVAQIFTLVHELAHVWVGESGISNPDFRKKSVDQVNRIEQFCNAVAAEVLVPASGFRRNWNAQQGVTENMYRLSALYRVSRFVILRQAVELSVISLPTYLRHLRQEYEKYIGVKKEDTGGNFYNSLFARNSYKLTATLTSALADGRVLYIDAARLLGVRVPILENLAAKL
jgi:Zn-dependent peptidase ImmA (M78 family)/DNA-binding XRE family transcriptional regulator